jgi:hypothetical protein
MWKRRRTFIMGEDLVQAYLTEVGEKYSKSIRIRSKSESRLLRLIAPLVMLFNKRFMSGYVTTIGSTIWVPSEWNTRSELSRLEVVSHEVIHVFQKKVQHRFGLHEVLYLFPQVLAVFALLSFLAIPFSILWLWCLGFLLFLGPLPAPWRMAKEVEAYRTRLLFGFYVYGIPGRVHDRFVDDITRTLSGSDYYFCWPFRGDLEKRLTGPGQTDRKIYHDLLRFLETHHLLRHVE